MRIKIFIYLSAAAFLIGSFASASEIHDAVLARDAAKVTELLKKDKSLVNSITPSGMTPLHYAASYDSDRIARILIQYGANYQAVTRNGVTPLQVATRNGSAKFVKLLITRTPIIYRTRYLDTSFPEGRKAKKDGELTKANDLITELMRDDPGNVHLNFANGLVCTSLEDFSRAGMAFERVLQINPGNDRARLELAKTYIATEQRGLAKKELELVLSHNPPTSLRKRLDYYLKQLKKSRKRWILSGRTDVAFFNDDNVNVGPVSSIIGIDPIIVGSTVVSNLSLSEASQPLDSTGYSALLALSSTYDIGDPAGWTLTGDAAYYQTWLDESSDYENLFATCAVGARKFFGRSMIHMKAHASHISTGGDPLLNIYGVSPSFLYAMGKKGQVHLTSKLTAEARQYDKLTYRDGFYLSFDERAKWFLGKKGHNLSVGAVIKHDSTDSDAYSYLAYGVRGGGELRLPWKVSAYAEVSYESSEYKEKEDLAPEKRSDDDFSWSAGLSKQINWFSGIDINHQSTDNSSTFGIYEYDRAVTTVSVYIMF